MKTRRSARGLVLFASLAMFAIAGLAGCGGGSSQHQSYATAEEAVDGMIAAVRSGDPTQLRAVFGPGTEDVIGSGDPVADTNDRNRFLAMYDAKHTLVPDGADRMTLTVGDDAWPLPVPVVKRGERWYLDGAAGVEEIAMRRVGRNELGAIAVCRGFVDAELDYAATGHDGLPKGIYAQKLLSDPGAHNGLYWEPVEGEPASPIGPFIAGAAAEGYRPGGGGTYHGYRYRPLYAQGPNAAGGAVDYFVSGFLARGFALISWPAEYGVSGVKTFVVNQAGVVYEKDLGADTATAVDAIQAFDPDSTWTVVPEEELVVVEGEMVAPAGN